jgi:transposase
VAKRYLPVRRDEPMLLPPDVREWLPADHVVWFLLDVIAALETSVLHRRSRLGGAGRAPYDPDMLLAVLVYAYAGGLRSSRKIEKRCQEDAAFMVVSGLCRPDHVTIARFRQNNTDAMDDLFDQILVLCLKAGLGNLEHVAIDGTKIAADASPAMSRDVDGLRGTGRRWLAEAAKVDDEEDERFGGRRGDELPEELQDPAQRRRVIADLIEKAGSDPAPKRGRARQRKARKGEQALELADELQAEAQTNAEVDLQRPMDRLARAEARLAKVRAQFQAQADDRARREEEAEGGICGPRPVPVEQQARVRQQVARVERDRQRLTERRNQSRRSDRST